MASRPVVSMIGAIDSMGRARVGQWAGGRQREAGMTFMWSQVLPASRGLHRTFPSRVQAKILTETCRGRSRQRGEGKGGGNGREGGKEKWE
jgi:hypothetical protein